MPRILLPHPVESLRQLFGTESLRLLGDLGELRLNESGAAWDRDRLLAEAREADILHSFGSTAADAAFFEAVAGSRLRAFCRSAVDIRNIDLAAATRAGILVTHGVQGFSAAVSELVIGLILDLSRRISANAASYHAGTVAPSTLTPDVHGTTLGLIGFGAISRHLVGLARAFDMRILACDPYASIDMPGVTACDMATLLAQSDHVVCLAKATEETERLMNAAAFAAMKPSAFFINVSRGDLVDEDALRAALDNGEIAGAGLDVGRAPRQMPTPELAAHPKVIATPHVGGLTPGAVGAQSAASAEQVAAILSGRRPERMANPEVAPRLGLA